MINFHYYDSATVEDARRRLAREPDARLLAGGTTLIDLMKLDVERPPLIIDVNRLPLAQIAVDGEVVRVGALVRNSALAYYPEIARRYPLLAQALLSGASAQLRNMATVGGNLMQRTRCGYFRDPALPCNKREPGSGCGALSGVHRMHAILGTSEHCIATHASDMCVALAALDAVILVSGDAGERRIAFDDFYRLPGDTPERETALAAGEIIVAVELPDLPMARRSGYVKVRDRASYEFALASAAVALAVDGNGMIEAARVALGGVGTRPWRSPEAERELVGRPAAPSSYRAAADAALAAAQPRRDNAYKVELAKATLVRALESIGGGA